MPPITYPVIATQAVSTSGDITALPPDPTDTPFSAAWRPHRISPILATDIQLMASLLIPAQLIIIIIGTASVEQDIALLRDYLHQATTHIQHHGRRLSRAMTWPAKPHHQRSGLPTTNSIASGTPFRPQIRIEGDRATRTRPLDIFIGTGE